MKTSWVCLSFICWLLLFSFTSPSAQRSLWSFWNFLVMIDQQLNLKWFYYKTFCYKMPDRKTCWWANKAHLQSHFFMKEYFITKLKLCWAFQNWFTSFVKIRRKLNPVVAFNLNSWYNFCQNIFVANISVNNSIPQKVFKK